jgi:hypothetical protein
MSLTVTLLYLVRLVVFFTPGRVSYFMKVWFVPQMLGVVGVLALPPKVPAKYG